VPQNHMRRPHIDRRGIQDRIKDAAGVLTVNERLKREGDLAGHFWLHQRSLYRCATASQCEPNGAHWRASCSSGIHDSASNFVRAYSGAADMASLLSARVVPAYRGQR